MIIKPDEGPTSWFCVASDVPTGKPWPVAWCAGRLPDRTPNDVAQKPQTCDVRGAEMMTSDSKHLPSFRPTERHESWQMGFIHFLWRLPKAPWHHVGSFPGMTLHSQDGPESFHTCRFDGRKWRVSVTPSPVQTSCVSRSRPSTNRRIGSSWVRSINSGNHDAAGCSWAIKITFTPGDWAIFCSTWGTILNGGKA